MLLPAQDIRRTTKVSKCWIMMKGFFPFFSPAVPQKSWFLQHSGRRSNGPVHPSDRDWAGESRDHQGGIHRGTTQGCDDMANNVTHLGLRHAKNVQLYENKKTGESFWSLCYFCSLQEFSEEDYLAIVNGWKEKLARSRSGDQRWGLFYATKDWLYSE